MSKSNLDIESFNKILAVEIEWISSQTNKIVKDWGILFYDKLIQEMNYALILDPSKRPQEIIDEILDFYNQRNINPRIQFYQSDTNHPFLETLQSKAFVKNKKGINKHVLIYSRTDPPPPQFSHPEGTMLVKSSTSNLNNWFREDLQKFFMLKEKITSGTNFVNFMLYLEGEPVAVVSAYVNQKTKNARLASLLTQPEFRNRGFATYLLNYIARWLYKKKMDVFLFVSDDYIKEFILKVGFKLFYTFQDSSFYFERQTQKTDTKLLKKQLKS